MIGITEIASYICERKNLNIDKVYEDTSDDIAFFEKKLGIFSTSAKEDNEQTSDLCIKAFNNLNNIHNIDINKIDCIAVCTQSHDFISPHTSAIVLNKLNANNDCAVFDINMGCGGYVYSLTIMKSFMESCGYKHGLLFNCEIFSDKVSDSDRNAGLVFGDASSVTYLSEDYKFSIGLPLFYNDKSLYDALILTRELNLTLKSIPIFSFVMGNIPALVNNVLEKNNLLKSDIDIFAFQQTGKYMLDNLSRRMKIPSEQIPFIARDYGNTSSVSVSLILEKYINNLLINNMLLCGFGEGLSASAVTIARRKNG